VSLRRENLASRRALPSGCRPELSDRLTLRAWRWLQATQRSKLGSISKGPGQLFCCLDRYRSVDRPANDQAQPLFWVAATMSFPLLNGPFFLLAIAYCCSSLSERMIALNFSCSLFKKAAACAVLMGSSLREALRLILARFSGLETVIIVLV
jgi:hypothetical protein